MALMEVAPSTTSESEIQEKNHDIHGDTVTVASVVRGPMAPIRSVASRVTAMPNWARTIHGRRRPIEGQRIESMRGAHRNLKLHGKIATEEISTVSTLVKPPSMKIAISA